MFFFQSDIQNIHTTKEIELIASFYNSFPFSVAQRNTDVVKKRRFNVGVTNGIRPLLSPGIFMCSEDRNIFSNFALF